MCIRDRGSLIVVFRSCWFGKATLDVHPPAGTALMSADSSATHRHAPSLWAGSARLWCESSTRTMSPFGTSKKRLESRSSESTPHGYVAPRELRRETSRQELAAPVPEA